MLHLIQALEKNSYDVALLRIRMESEYGNMLMYNGVRLKQGFAGTGYNNETRYFQDFDSRMYFMEKE